MGEGPLFNVIGVGPGDPKYLTKIASDLIDRSRLLIGARRHLQSFASNGQDTMELTGSNIQEIINFLKENKDKKSISVLVSGDPGFYSFGNLIIDNFGENDFEFIPGISSMQLAFSKLKIAWDDCVFISLHGKELSPDLMNEAGGKIDMFKTCCFLGDKRTDPIRIIEGLVNRDSFNAFLLSDLSLSTELIQNINHKDEVELDGSGNWILILEKK